MGIELNINTFLIVSAVAGETEDILKTMQNVRAFAVGGRSAFQGELSGKPLLLLVTGPGVVNTAQSLGAVLEHGRPGLIIQCGCAGLFNCTSGRIGDLGIATRETDIHSGIEPEDPLAGVPRPLPFPLLETANGPFTNTFPMDQNLVDMAYALLCHEFGSQKVRVFNGPFITVSTITATDPRAHMLCTAYNPVMESMEGSAAAQVATHYGIPFLEIRSASNRVGKRDRSSWDLPLAFRNSARAVIHLVKNIKLDVTGEKSKP